MTFAKGASALEAVVRRPLFTLVLAALALVRAGDARGAEADDAISLSVVHKTMEGHGTPELIVRAEMPVKSVEIDLLREGKKRVQMGCRALLAGETKRFALDVGAVGRARFVGKIVVRRANQEAGEMPLDLEVEVVAPLVLTVAPNDLDLAERRLRVGANRALKAVQTDVFGDDGERLGGAEVEVDGVSVEAAWESKPGTTMRIRVTGTDRDGFHGSIDLFPWRVDIPHEEVNFETAKSEIRRAEEGKLTASLSLLKAAIQRYGRLAAVSLFVAGHTDTVGDAGSNRVLARERARAIGRWFRQHGIQVPISVTGCGEDVLRVATKNDTDEPKNRRAEYIVAVDAPNMPCSTWERL